MTHTQQIEYEREILLPRMFFFLLENCLFYEIFYQFHAIKLVSTQIKFFKKPPKKKKCKQIHKVEKSRKNPSKIRNLPERNKNLKDLLKKFLTSAALNPHRKLFFNWLNVFNQSTYDDVGRFVTTHTNISIKLWSYLTSGQIDETDWIY